MYLRSVLHNNIYTENIYVVDTFSRLNGINYTSPSSFFHLNSSIDTQFFNLTTSTNFLKQTIYNHTHLYSFQVAIFDNPSLTVDLTLTLLVAFILTSFLSKIKIIF